MFSRTTHSAFAAIVLVLMAAAAFAQTRTLSIGAVRTQPAQEQRVALVIGNGDYAQAPLRNPVNDARAIAAELRQAGFKVTLLENADLERMFEAIRDFGDQLRAGGVGLFYFAGHGVQIRGRNYLIPVAAQIQREDEVVYRSLDAGQVLQKMETAGNRVNIVILDACRNNPFQRTFRSIPAGLAVMEAPVNTLVAFATAPGAVASDGTGTHGLYTEHLLKNIPVEGLRVEDMFKRVRAGVRQDSAGRQTPWENTSLEVEFYFRPLATQVAAEPPPAPSNPLAIELAFWDSIKSSGAWADFDAYLRKYPAGQFTELARNRLVALRPPPPPAAASVAAIHKPPSKPAPVSSDPAKVLPGAEVASTAMAVSPNGGYVVSGSRDGVLSVWDVTTSKELRRLMGHSGAILAVGLSPDGRWIASGGEDASLRLWSISGISELRRIRADGAVTALAYSPNGRHLVSGDRAGTVRLWSAADGTLITRFAGHPASVRAVAFSMEGRYVLSGGADGMVRIWDVSSGAGTQSFGPHSSEVIAVRMPAGAASVVSASADGVVWSWDMRSGKGSSSSMAAAAGTGVMVALSNDGRNALIARNDGNTVLWDTGAAREIRRFSAPASAVTAVALSSEGRLALVAADGQRIRLWSIRD
jgi:WD40 repeat protein